MANVAVSIRVAASSLAGRSTIVQRLIGFGVEDLACTHPYGIVTGVVAANRIGALGLIEGIASVTRQGNNGYAQA